MKKAALTQQGKKKAEEELKNLESLSEYVTYSKLSKTMERNLLLVEAAVTRFNEFGTSLFELLDNFHPLMNTCLNLQA